MIIIYYNSLNESKSNTPSDHSNRYIKSITNSMEHPSQGAVVNMTKLHALRIPL